MKLGYGCIVSQLSLYIPICIGIPYIEKLNFSLFV